MSNDNKQSVELARKLDAEAALITQKKLGAERDNELKSIEVANRRHAVEVREAGDFTNGYFVFNDAVGSSSVDYLLTSLRRFSRLHPGRDITIELFSPGGSIIDGFRLYDELVRLKSAGGHFLTIRVRGHAASMAVPILQAADVREVGPSAWLMIHRAAFGKIGKAYEVEDQVEFVQRIENRIAEIIAARSHHDLEFFADLFSKRKDIWYSAEEALDHGLVDRVA